MKKTLYSFALFTLFLMFFNVNDSKACIDPDSAIGLVISIDTNITKIELRFTNLLLHTENPNTFCSCAFGGSVSSSLFDFVTLVAFVDQGTNNIYPNFGTWDSSALASTSWQNNGIFDARGFIGQVTNAGLSFNDAVDLIICIEPGPGYTISIVDSTISATTFGNDMWDSATASISMAHTGYRNLAPWSSALTSRILNVNVPDSYFDSVNNALTSGIEEYQSWQESDFHVNPNPVYNTLSIASQDFNSEKILGVKIYDIAGKLVLEGIPITNGSRTAELVLPESLNDGIYVAELKTKTGMERLRFDKRSN